MTWQPIETAPRDGTWIHVYEDGSGGFPGPHCRRWNAEAKLWEGVEDPLGRHILTRPGVFTHWQPLPESRGSEASEGVGPATCGSCQFWHLTGDGVGVAGRWGKCRRFPPSFTHETDPRGQTLVFTDHPRTPSDAGCGEWVARKVAPLEADICPETGGEHVWLDTSTTDGDGRKCLKCGREG